MISRAALSLVLGLGLLASLSLKLPGNTEVVSRTASQIPAEVASLLERQGLEVSRGPTNVTLPWVSGAAGACQMLIAEVAPQGWHRSLVAQAALNNHPFYTFAGRIYSEQPIVQTRAHYYWRKLHRYLGLRAPDQPVLAVVATPACQNVPLQDLAALTARV